MSHVCDALISVYMLYKDEIKLRVDKAKNLFKLVNIQPMLTGPFSLLPNHCLRMVDVLLPSALMNVTYQLDIQGILFRFLYVLWID